MTITVDEEEEDEEEAAAGATGGGPPPPPRTFPIAPSGPSPFAMSHSGVPGKMQGSAPSFTASTCLPMAAPARRPRMRSLRPLGLGEEGEDTVAVVVVAAGAVAVTAAAAGAAELLPPLALKTAA